MHPAKAFLSWVLCSFLPRDVSDNAGGCHHLPESLLLKLLVLFPFGASLAGRMIGWQVVEDPCNDLRKSRGVLKAASKLAGSP